LQKNYTDEIEQIRVKEVFFEEEFLDSLTGHAVRAFPESPHLN